MRSVLLLGLAMLVGCGKASEPAKVEATPSNDAPVESAPRRDPADAARTVDTVPKQQVETGSSIKPENALPRTDADPPVQAHFLGRTFGKPTLTFHSVRLVLANRHDTPIWIVLPYWGDRPSPEKGVFLNNSVGMPFGGKEYEGDGGSAIGVSFHGENGFKAFRLPAKSRVELDDYVIEAWKEIGEIVVLEAEELKVNGKTSLDKWLPYGTTSGTSVKASRDKIRNWKNLDWDAKRVGSREDYPKEKVENVKAEGVTRWSVKFQK